MASEKSVVISIRLPERIKNRISELAEAKGTSLNDICSNTLTDMVHNLSDASFELPSAEEAIKLREDNKQKLIEKSWAVTKTYVKEMIDQGKVWVQIPKKEIAEVARYIVEERLQELGYAAYVVQHGFSIDGHPIFPSDKFDKFDIVVALEEKDIKQFIMKDEYGAMGLGNL